MSPELTKAGCVSAAKQFTGLGLDYAFCPIFGSSHSEAIWRSKVESESLSDLSNVCVRPGKDLTGAFTSFGIRVSANPYAPVPLDEVPAYRFLRNFDTLRFEAGSAAVMAFACDPFVIVTEGLEYADRVFAGSLQGAQLVTATGWLGYGVQFDTSGRSVRVTSYGDTLANVRDYPSLLDALKQTGRVKVSADIRVGPASGPPMLA